MVSPLGSIKGGRIQTQLGKSCKGQWILLPGMTYLPFYSLYILKFHVFREGFNKGQDVSLCLCESVHRTSTCFRCYRPPQINSCMITSNKNTHICSLTLYTLEKLTKPFSSHLINSYLISSLKSSKSDV